MQQKNRAGSFSLVKSSLSIFLIIIAVCSFTAALPVGPSLKSSHTDEYIAPDPLMLNHSKGSITSVSLNVTGQSMNWKAYVGNVSGRLTLDDTENYTIYDWTYTQGEGEVFATKSDSVDWDNVICANTTTILAEDTDLNHIAGHVDSINSTFSNNTHPQFYVGEMNFAEDGCDYNLYTYVNETSMDTFPEVIIYDETNENIIYTAIMADGSAGYNNENFDFQMLVSDDSTMAGTTAYYFYVELT